MSDGAKTVVALGVVQSVDDGGQAQTVVVQTADGVTRGAVEVQQAFGFASRPPADGAVALTFAVGADAANVVALPLGCPAVRFGDLAPGEAVLYGSDGTRVAIRAGGTVEVQAATAVIVNTGSVTVTAPGGVAIDGDVRVTGSIFATGDISDLSGLHGTLGTLRADYNVHTHTDSRGGTTSTPTPQTP